MSRSYTLEKNRGRFVFLFICLIFVAFPQWHRNPQGWKKKLYPPPGAMKELGSGSGGLAPIRLKYGHPKGHSNQLRKILVNIKSKKTHSSLKLKGLYSKFIQWQSCWIWM